MTPKEKALERLLFHYSAISGMDISFLKKLNTLPKIGFYYEEAKICVLGEIDELIEATNFNPFYVSVKEELKILLP